MKLLPVFLVLLLLPFMGSHAATFDHNHPYFALLGNSGWDASEQADIHVNADGTAWVKTGDGRIRAGSWRLNPDGNVCLIVGGVMEGCWEVTKHNTTLVFKESKTGNEFNVKIRPGRSEVFIRKKQQQLYAHMTKARGIIATDRGGDEYVYWHRDGLLNVVQPEGWIKIGSWWFDDQGRVCDNVNGFADCLTIESIERDRLVVGWFVGGKKTLVEVRMDINRP